jgi:hypothetical protein
MAILARIPPGKLHGEIKTREILQFKCCKHLGLFNGNGSGSVVDGPQHIKSPPAAPTMVWLFGGLAMSWPSLNIFLKLRCWVSSTLLLQAWAVALLEQRLHY